MPADEKMKRLEKRVSQIERTTNKNFQQVEEAFSAFRDVLLKMQRENEQLKNDRDFLLNAYKIHLKTLSAPSLREEIKRNLVEKTGSRIRENFELVRNVAAESLGESRMDDLFELVFLEGKIKSRDASKRLNVHEKQVEEWAARLEKMNLIETRPFKGQIVLRKRG